MLSKQLPFILDLPTQGNNKRSSVCEARSWENNTEDMPLISSLQVSITPAGV